MRAIAAVVIAGLLGVAVPVLAFASLVLPSPSGPYAVGRVTHDWTDAARAGRELKIIVWYPAALSRPTPLSPLVPDGWLPSREPDREWFARLAQPLAGARVHATPGAPLSPSPGGYPLLIMPPGLGRLVIEYTTIAEDLASHGYIVVGVMPSRRPSGQVKDELAAWVDDAGFVVNRFERLKGSDVPLGMLAGAFDMQSVGVFGHSFGGAVAVQACRRDGRFRAGVDIDGYPPSPDGLPPLAQPFMFIWSEAGEANARSSTARSDAEAIAVDHGYHILIRGTRHFNFSDHAAFQSSDEVAVGPIDGRRGLMITTNYIRAFFDRYLKGADAPLLSGPSPYTEVVRLRLADPVAP